MKIWRQALLEYIESLEETLGNETVSESEYERLELVLIQAKMEAFRIGLI